MLVCEGDRIVVIGVSSFQWNPAGARCQNDNYTVGAYVEVQAYLPWIRKTIGEGNNSECFLIKQNYIGETARPVLVSWLL